MSAFCVFGVTMIDCVIKAELRTGSYCRKSKRWLSADEWKERVNLLANQYFEAGKFSRQISPAFDAPQFARDWISVAERTCKSHSLKIMNRGEKIDHKGNPVVRKGKPVIGWIAYKSCELGGLDG